MKKDKDTSVAESLETSVRLLPYLPYLLQDLWALGGSVEDIISLIGDLDLPAKTTRILDLGCGKGAVSIRLAQKFGFNVVGIDAMQPFLKVASEKARAFGVSQLCKFEMGDIHAYVSDRHDFDVVILASLGGLFGSLKKTVGVLRSQIKTAGYIIIDDGYLKNKLRLKRAGYFHYTNHETSIRALTSFGDQILREINTTDLSKRINFDYLESMSRRSVQLAVHHPELANEIQSYMERQKEECKFIDEMIEGALWLLQKKMEDKSCRSPSLAN